MTTNLLIKKLTKLIEDTCKKPSNIYGYGAWSQHIKKVIYFAKILAQKNNADKQIVEISAILHDYASVLDSKMYSKHEIFGAKLAQDLLQKDNYPQDKIDRVKNCILNHRGSKPRTKMTIEEICIADADAMAHFTSIGSLFYLCFNTHKLSIEESEKWILKKLERSYKKISPMAREIINPYYISAQKILNHDQ